MAAVAELGRWHRMRTMLLITCLVILTGCRSSQYGVCVENSTSTVLQDVRIIFPHHTVDAGELGSDPSYPAHFLSFPVPGPLPTNATVQYRTPDAATHTVDLGVPRPSSKRVLGGAYWTFTIYTNHYITVEKF